MDYRPRTLKGETLEELKKGLMDEFLTIARAMQEEVTIELRPIYAAPEKPRAGMLVYADGTTWNPGSGEGLYRYTLAAAWDFVG